MKTIEQKALAYDEALEKAKRLYEKGTITESLCHIFPELCESEDERVRKAILELVKQSSEILDKQNQNNMINWLEKQGEQQPVNWSEEDEEHYKACLQYFDTVKPDMVYYNDYQWLKQLKQRIEG